MLLFDLLAVLVISQTYAFVVDARQSCQRKANASKVDGLASVGTLQDACTNPDAIFANGKVKRACHTFHELFGRQKPESEEVLEYINQTSSFYVNRTESNWHV